LLADKLKIYKLPGIDQILAELMQAGGLHFESHRVINPILNREELSQHWKESVILPTSNIFIKRTMKLTVVIVEGYSWYQLHTKFYPAYFSEG
jgi:hypothetical protein